MNQQYVLSIPCRICQDQRRNHKSKMYTQFSSIKQHVNRRHKPDYAVFMFLRELITMQRAIEVSET